MGFAQQLGSQAVTVAVVLGGLATLTGLPLARLLGLGPLCLPAAPMLGLALQAVSGSMVFLLAPPTGASALAHIGILLGGLWVPAWALTRAGGRRGTPGSTLPSGARPAEPWAAGIPWLMLASAALGAFAMADAWPRIIDGGLYLRPAVHDHARVVFIDAIARGGLPPDNPLYAPGRAVNLVYYSLWPLLAAEGKWLVGASGWAADLGLSWVSYGAVLCLVAGLAARLAGRVLAGAFALVICSTGSLLPLVPGTGVADPGGLLPVFEQVRWAPHHVLGAGALLLLTHLIAGRAVARPGVTPVTEGLAMGCLAAFAAGGSGWLAVAFALVSPLLAGVLVRHLGLRSLVRLLPIAVLAVALVLPVLVSVTRPPCGHTGAALAPALLPAVRAPLPAAFQAVLYWLWFLPWVLGPLLMLGALGLWSARRPADPSARLFLHLSLVLVFGVLLVCQGVRSALVNNDLGWRASLLPQLLLVLWGAVGLHRLFVPTAAADNAVAGPGVRRALVVKGWTLRVLAVGLLGMGLLSAARGLRGTSHPASAPDAAAHRALLDQVRAFGALRAQTLPSERVLSNPHGFEDMLPWPINIDFLLFGDRDSAFAHPHWVVTYCPGESAEALNAIHGLVARVFLRPRPVDLLRLRDGLGVDALLVTARDRGFGSPVYEASGAYRLVQSDPAFSIFRATAPSLP